VPDVEDLDTLRLLADVVENAVRTKDDHTQCTSCAARIDGTNKGKGRQDANVFEDAPADSSGELRVMLSDVGPDVLKVRNRRV